MNDFKLDNAPKTTAGFNTPEHYFDTFSERLDKKLMTNEPQVISFYARNKKSIFAIAAVLVLAFSIPFFMTKPATVNDIDNAVIVDYLAYNTKMTTYELVEYLDKEDLEQLHVDFNIQDADLEESLNKINVENYLIY